MVEYVTGQVYKDVVDNFPSFRTIFFETNTLAHKLTKFLVPILKCLTSNEYTTKKNFSLLNKILIFLWEA